MTDISGTDRPRQTSEREKLTEREKQILRLLCDGLTNAQIATRMNVSSEIVKSSLKRIFRKIDVKNRTQAAVRAVHHDHQTRMGSASPAEADGATARLRDREYSSRLERAARPR